MDFLEAWVRLWLAIRRSPILYRAFLNLKGISASRILPAKEDRFFLTGYQRSGNSYSKKLCEFLFPDVEFASHVHTISSLKLALDIGLPVVVLIRDPENSVASSIVQQVARGKSLRTALKSVYEYVDYYEFILQEKEQLKIIEFDSLKEEPAVLIYALTSIVKGLSMPSLHDIQVASEIVVAGIKAHDSLPESHGWHSPEKEKSKEAVLAKIERLPAFGRAKELYTALRAEVRKERLQ